jgi:hypothetical protein
MKITIEELIKLANNTEVDIDAMIERLRVYEIVKETEAQHRKFIEDIKYIL